MTSFAMDKYPCVGFFPHNNTFVSFIADKNLIGINVFPDNCNTGDGLQVIVYDSQRNPVSECVKIHGFSPIDTIFIDSLIIGERYTIMIDGLNADVCDFIVALTGSRTTNTENLEATKHKSFSVYPNPTKNEINIKFQKHFQKEVKIILYDALGKTLIEHNFKFGNISIPIYHFKKGIYILEIFYQNKRIGIERILKE